MIRRLRPKYTDEELKRIYATPHDHSIFPDHVLRVNSTLELGKQLLGPNDESGADLSCGNGYLLNKLPLHTKYFGDFAPGYEYEGPIEETIGLLPSVDVFVFCETIEHLDDPLAVLKLIRAKAKKLILSTPHGEHTDDNPEHYWGWDKAGIAKLLKKSGWLPSDYRHTYPPMGYEFQIWGCY